MNQAKKERNKKYYKNNKERLKANSRKYYQNNKDRLKITKIQKYLSGILIK